MKVSRLLFALLLCTLAYLAHSQTPAPVAPANPAATAPVSEPDMPLSAAMRTQALDELATQLTANYVFPEVASQMVAALRLHDKQGRYAQAGRAADFARMLTDDLRAVSHDKHLHTSYEEESQAAEKPGVPSGQFNPAAKASRAAFGRATNFGFAKYENLDGNVAYLELRAFQDDEAGAETVAAAMGMVANADALIIDLRRNGGGSPRMVALVSSYLFGTAPVHLNDLYWRYSGKTEHFSTRPDAPGPHFGPDKPVYILTSHYTFSAGEEFSYDLQQQKRATIVGETTGGGANPGRTFRTGEHFSTFIPTGRAINPISKTNWEGTGVTPDVATPAEQALLTAHIMAIKPLIARKTDALKRDPEVRLAALQAKLDALKAAPAR